MPNFDKYYTIEEANSLLPEVREVLAELQAARDSLVEDWQKAEPVIRAAATNGGGAEGSAYVSDLSLLSRHLRWFSQHGILVKDIDVGLIDFPAMRDGEEVLLCWKLGEGNIAYWHSLEEGFAGRQPL